MAKHLNCSCGWKWESKMNSRRNCICWAKWSIYFCSQGNVGNGIWTVLWWCICCVCWWNIMQWHSGREWYWLEQFKVLLGQLPLALVGNVVDMSPTCLNVGQMSKNFEINTNVHNTEKVFYSESRVCGMSWSQIVSERGLADKKYLWRKYFSDV